MFIVAHGSLILDRIFWVTDGVVWYVVLSPSLLFRFIDKKPTRKYINGKWVMVHRFIVLFKKTKYVHRHTALGETYHRESIKRKKNEFLSVP